MNERIRELAEEAGFIQSWFSESGDDFERKIKKFAEFIVLESIVEMLEQLYTHGIDESNNPAFYKAVEQTKLYFGIKERTNQKFSLSIDKEDSDEKETHENKSN
jgi:hypothetical protein